MMEHQHPLTKTIGTNFKARPVRRKWVIAKSRRHHCLVLGEQGFQDGVPHSQTPPQTANPFVDSDLHWLVGALNFHIESASGSD